MHLEVSESGRTLILEPEDKLKCTHCDESEPERLYYCSDDKRLYCLKCQDNAIVKSVECTFYVIDQVKEKRKSTTNANN